MPIELYNELIQIRDREAGQPGTPTPIATSDKPLLSELISALPEEKREQANFILQLARKSRRVKLKINDFGEFTFKNSTFNIWTFIAYCVKGDLPPSDEWRFFKQLVVTLKIPQKRLSKVAKLDLRLFKKAK